MGVWVRYRLGVDAIWTGLGLPTEEMSYEDRLGYVERTEEGTEEGGAEGEGGRRRRGGGADKKGGKKGGKRGDTTGAKKGRSSRAAKDLRRAYYRTSLQWHPDRWASMPALYLPAVQGVFELVSGAYQQLSRALAPDDPVEDAYA